MPTVAKIQQAIMNLSEADYAELCRWLLDQDWQEWDREIEEDVRAGKLDVLTAEALEAKAKGELKENCVTNKIDLSPIFEVYSLREQQASKVTKALTQAFKSRVWLSCKEMVQPYDHYSEADHKIADFWMTLRDKLRYRHGVDHLSEVRQATLITELEKFLSECSDEHYLDFVEMFFQSEKLPMHFSDHDLKEAVNNINTFFDLDELPYTITEFFNSRFTDISTASQETTVAFATKV